jgi:hypothetical protein
MWKRSCYLLVFLIILAGAFGLVSCAKNTAGSEVDDGRIFFMTDIAPNRVASASGKEKGYLKIITTVEGFEVPFTKEIISEANGRPFDLLEQVITGDSEVTIQVTSGYRGWAGMSFILDGNALIRLRLKDPHISSATSVWVLERF